MKEKHHLVQIHHIKAHAGVESPAQRGNDAADKMAKEYMTKGEELEAAPFFTAYEEDLVLFPKTHFSKETLEHG